MPVRDGFFKDDFGFGVGTHIMGVGDGVLQLALAATPCCPKLGLFHLFLFKVFTKLSASPPHSSFLVQLGLLADVAAPAKRLAMTGVD